MRAILLLALLGACDAASSDPGLAALLHVDGAQYVPGPFPVDDGGPDGLQVSTFSSQIRIDVVGQPVTATLEAEARTAVLGIEGVDGAWIIPAGIPELDTPDLPAARATFALSPALEAGPFVLLAAGGDADGRVGAPARAMLVANEVPPPTGELVIALVWQGDADLDIHVVDPLGGESWSQKPNTMPEPKPGDPPRPPGAHLDYGILDHDGNKDCRRDGRPAEHIVWTRPPPSGEYIVRVDARSMCGAPNAYWYVAAYRNGELIEGSTKRGVSTQADVTRAPDPPAQWHGAGAGILAVRFAL